MIDFSNTSLQKVAIHFVGNKGREEGVYISGKIFSSFDELTEQNFLKYFTDAFKNTAAFYNFHHPADIELNEVRSIANGFFSGQDEFADIAEKLAQILYDRTTHHNISGGEFFVVQFKGAIINDLATPAIGIYKSEAKEIFLKLEKENDAYDYHMESGIDLNALEKGCMIFKSQDAGDHTVCIVDNNNKQKEANYWTNDFLKLMPRQDSYHFTKDYLDVAKKFVTERLPEAFDVSKADKIDYLNKSINYFKNNSHFQEEDFLQDVFQHEEVIDTFTKFKDQHNAEHGIILDNDFDISNQAVKKQARVFKSILKLDKNFHIYIHGNKDLIEKGVDESGRKFYKIYYNEES